MEKYALNRIKALYELFNEELYVLTEIEDSETRIGTFLECIDYKDADDLLKNILRCVEKELKEGKNVTEMAIKNSRLSRVLVEYGMYKEIDWNTFTIQMRSIYNNWKYAMEVRRRLGKNISTTELVKLYVYSVSIGK